MPRPAGTVPLTMACPRCGAYLPHPVVRAIPTYCELPESASRLLRGVLGRTLLFRALEKRCLGCDATFRSAELPQDELFALAEAFAAVIRANQDTVREEPEPPRPARALHVRFPAWIAAAALLAGLAAAPRDAAAAPEAAFQDAVASYRAGRHSDAFGKMMALAQAGDPDAARVALFMHQFGPALYGSYWDLSPDEVGQFTRLAAAGRTRRNPEFQPISSPERRPVPSRSLKPVSRQANP